MKTVSCVKCTHPLHVEADWSWGFKKCPVCGERTDLPPDWRLLPEDAAKPVSEAPPEPWQPPASSAPLSHHAPLQPRGRAARAFFAAGASLLLVFGGILIVMGSMGTIDFLAGDSRLATQGTVLESSIKSAQSPGRFHLTSYTPQVTFEYKVNDKKYLSARVSFWDPIPGAESVAERVVQRYPQHTRPTVYYRADDPADGVLELGWKWQPASYAILGLSLVWLSLRVLVSNVCDRSTVSGLLSRRWTPVDKLAMGVLLGLGVFLTFNLCWFE